jgi:AraC-like DNA-binding protein
MNQAIIDTVAITTAILLLIFASFVFSYKKGRRISNRILGVFLLANSLYILDFSLNVIEKSLGLNLHWFNGIGSSFGFLCGPLLYLYSKSLTREDFSLKVTDSAHMAIFIIALLTTLIDFGIPANYWFGILFLQIAPYMVACIIVITKYRRQIKNYYSSIEKFNLTWMLYIVGAFFIMWIMDCVDLILISYGLISNTIHSYMVFLSLFINFIFAILIFYKALQHPEVFSGSFEQNNHEKYAQSHLTENEKNEYLKKLEKFFKREKPFLNPHLTINDVAEELGISSRYLSQIINESFQKNFYDFINSYRIDEAKKNLIDKEDPKKTILEVLYDSGFNSKSAFNAAFKRYTGCTPTQFKKKLS